MPLISFASGPAWPTAQSFGDCSCAHDDLFPDWIDATECAGPGWCVGSEWARWSDGARYLKVRSPIGLRFQPSGVADLGAGLYAVGCHPYLMHRSEPALVCVLELHDDIGLLRINRVFPVFSSEHASLPGLADWTFNRESQGALLGGRIEDDLLVAFADSLARVSLAEWAPEPPVVCTWGTDFCFDGTVQGAGLLVRDNDTYAIDLVCERPTPAPNADSPQPYCATCTLPAYGARGTTRAAVSLERGRCLE